MKTVFKNRTFFYLLAGFIPCFTLWNAFTCIISENYWLIMPILVQIALLILILTGNSYTKITITSWAIIFMIGAPALELLSFLIYMGSDMLDDTAKWARFSNVIYDLVQLSIGIVILDFNRKTVKIRQDANQNLEELQP